MRETDVLVVGAGRTGVEAALAVVEAGRRVLVLDKSPDAMPLPPGLRVLGDAMALDVILSEAGEVAGALLVDQAANEVTPIRANAVVLATGGASGLYPSPRSPRETGDGFAIAHRAGADLADLTVAFTPDVHIVGGVATDRNGTTTVEGLYAAGETSSSRASGRHAGALAAFEAPAEPRSFGDFAVMPNIDSPLPRGFADVKLDRLREVMARHLGPAGPVDVESARIELHKLKGEADDFARARVDPDLLSLKNACEMAILLARAAIE